METIRSWPASRSGPRCTASRRCSAHGPALGHDYEQALVDSVIDSVVAGLARSRHASAEGLMPIPRSLLARDEPADHDLTVVAGRVARRTHRRARDQRTASRHVRRTARVLRRRHDLSPLAGAGPSRRRVRRVRVAPAPHRLARRRACVVAVPTCSPRRCSGCTRRSVSPTRRTRRRCRGATACS